MEPCAQGAQLLGRSVAKDDEDDDTEEADGQEREEGGSGIRRRARGVPSTAAVVGRSFRISDGASAMAAVPEILTAASASAPPPKGSWVNLLSGARTAWDSLLMVTEAVGGDSGLGLGSGGGAPTPILAVKAVDDQQVVDAAMALLRGGSSPSLAGGSGGGLLLGAGSTDDGDGDGDDAPCAGGGNCLVLPLDVQIWRTAVLFAAGGDGAGAG